MRERDLAAARGWACLLVQKLGEHFSEEERMMRTYGWQRVAAHAEAHGHVLSCFVGFERRLAVAQEVSLDLSQVALLHLPEVLRVHQIMSDFGFAKFAVGVTRPTLAPRVVPPVGQGRAA
jgi:hemerythrin